MKKLTSEEVKCNQVEVRTAGKKKLHCFNKKEVMLPAGNREEWEMATGFYNSAVVSDYRG